MAASPISKWVGLSLLGVLGGCGAIAAVEHVEEVAGLVSRSLQAFDTNGDGVVSFDEVCYWFLGANAFVWAEARGRWFGRGARKLKGGCAKLANRLPRQAPKAQ